MTAKRYQSLYNSVHWDCTFCASRNDTALKEHCPHCGANYDTGRYVAGRLGGEWIYEDDENILDIQRDANFCSYECRYIDNLTDEQMSARHKDFVESSTSLLEFCFQSP